MKISRIVARQILDSRGLPTVEAEVWLSDGTYGSAAVPSGASTGAYEAIELRDGGKAYAGKGVTKAIANIENKIAKAVSGLDADDQQAIDRKIIELDGTENKSRLGANATLAVSLACAHAAANAKKIPLYKHINSLAGNPAMSLPMPMFNVLNGGKHGSNSSDFQEFMVVPKSAATYAEATQAGVEIFQSLKKQIAETGASTSVGDEGGFTLAVKSNTEMLDVLSKATELAGYQPGKDIGFALDVASSEFFENGNYSLATEQRKLSGKEMIDYLAAIAEKYPILSIEDGLDQDAWEDWQALTGKLGKLQLVGDDLLVTNPKRLQRAIDESAGNAILIKLNQIGTLSETIETIQLAQKHGWRTVVSHRSGETEDVSIVHLAIGTGANQIKTGSLSRGERTAKHNELLRIESRDKTLRLAQPF